MVVGVWLGPLGTEQRSSAELHGTKNDPNEKMYLRFAFLKQYSKQTAKAQRDGGKKMFKQTGHKTKVGWRNL